MTPRITIRTGATRDEVEVDGKVFDRSRMVGAEKALLRRTIVRFLTPGTPTQPRRKHAQRRASSRS